MICGSMENQGASHTVYGIQDSHEVGEGGEGLMYPTESYWQLPSMHDDHHIDPIQHQPSFFASLSSLPTPHHPPPTSSLFTSLQFPYNRGDPNPYMASEGYFQARGLPSSSSPFVGLHAEFGRMTAQEFMDAKALAASKSHSEAERRRRERINAHLAKLRSMLPGTTKTDKASLLAEVIQHVKELKRQTSSMAEDGHSPLPTEFDELTIDSSNDEHGRRLVRAQLCCDDRSDLFPDLIKALKSLRLRTLKAEITTLAGRVKNVIVVTGEDDPACPSIASIQDALKAVMERQAHADESTSSGGTKRQRTNHLGGKHEGRATI